MLRDGYYEKLVNIALEEWIEGHDQSHYIEKEDLDFAEASLILSDYIRELVERSLDNVHEDKNSIDEKIKYANSLISFILQNCEEQQRFYLPEKAQILRAFLNRKNSIHKKQIVKELPSSSIAYSSLFTGNHNEPQMYEELKREIETCDQIDMLVSFIKWSGLRLLIDSLTEFTERGGKLRIISTSYMGATDFKAIEELRKLPNTKIKMSYDTKVTRLHAKTYVFKRESGFTTAYIGSSNLSNPALTTGLEWNVKVANNDQPSIIRHIEVTFEQYWESSRFEYYRETDIEKLQSALQNEKGEDDSISMPFFNIAPYGYQKEILDALEADREVHGRYRNLVVAATGTGKTVISAFDYLNFIKKNPNRKNRFLFIAHREEILKQACVTFRQVLRNQNFGELFVGNHRPETIDHLFMSIQTFTSKDFTQQTEKNFYDFIIVDEFHHSSAKSYQKLLEYYEPKIFLGLTATPERMDGKNVVEYFDNHISAEIRLPEAIDRQLLSPFQYFGVTDEIDLSQIRWTRGGYDSSELENLYALNTHVAKSRAKHIAEATEKYVTDIREVIGLGFCVSVKHAEFMATAFNQMGIPSIALSGKSDDKTRSTAKDKLVQGEIRFIFVVDLYNEGVDIPEINTVLFLRPTDSLTVFMQQLGRGLRLSEDKDCLTVLDFIGQANTKYNFEEKFRALAYGHEKSIEQSVKEGFSFLPRGCYIQLEKKAKDYILNNLKQSFFRKPGIIAKIRDFENDTGLDLTLKNFTEYYHLPLENIYRHDTFSRLKEAAGIIESLNEEDEKLFKKALPRLLSINSRRWLNFIISELGEPKHEYQPHEIRFLNMFHYSLFQENANSVIETRNNILGLKRNPILFAELKEVLTFLLEKIDFIDRIEPLHFDSPLDVYCKYTRDQVLIGLEYMKPNTVREGVRYLPDKKVDVLFVTLNKSEKDYSPSTMYRDYSINENFFHWQSQNATSETSKTGLRYQNHEKVKSHVLLFVREFNKEPNLNIAPAYVYFGPVSYVSHEGEKPMSITWKLKYPTPAKWVRKSNEISA